VKAFIARMIRPRGDDPAYRAASRPRRPSPAQQAAGWWSMPTASRWRTSMATIPRRVPERTRCRGRGAPDRGQHREAAGSAEGPTDAARRIGACPSAVWPEKDSGPQFAVRGPPASFQCAKKSRHRGVWHGKVAGTLLASCARSCGGANWQRHDPRRRHHHHLHHRPRSRLLFAVSNCWGGVISDEGSRPSRNPGGEKVQERDTPIERRPGPAVA
jgi:hypothetical protein